MKMVEQLIKYQMFYFQISEEIMKKCIEFCSIASDFPGSFIKCMHKLMRESQKENMKIEFVFPYEAKDKIWCKNLMKETKVFFI